MKSEIEFLKIADCEPRVPNSRHAIACTLLFLAGIFLYSWNNTFSPYYHPAEPNRAAQILTGDYNFQHPLLLLHTTKLITFFTHAQDIYAVTLVGRWVSVLYSSASIVLVFLIAYLLAGNWAAVTASLLTFLNDQLFNLAHYFKEDSAFAFGCLLTALVMIVYLRKPTLPNGILLGAATAIACSGKYLGIILFILVLAWTITKNLTSKQNACRHLLPLLVSTTIVFLIINFPMLSNLDEVGHSIQNSLSLAFKHSPPHSIPHIAYTSVFKETTDPIVWALLAVYLIGIILRRKQISLEEWFVIAVPITFFITLSFSSQVNYSYFLTALLYLLILAGCGLTTLLNAQWQHKDLIPASARISIIGFILLAITGFQIPSISDLGAAFKQDSRQQLIQFLDVLPSSTIAEDESVKLGTEYHWHQPAHAKHDFIGTLGDNDLNSYDKLLAANVTYVIIDSDNYGAYLKKPVPKEIQNNPNFPQTREMYTRILKRGRLLWESKSGKIPYLQPPLKLIQIQE